VDLAARPFGRDWEAIADDVGMSTRELLAWVPLAPAAEVEAQRAIDALADAWRDDPSNFGS
jgi:hypothetical protein